VTLLLLDPLLCCSVLSLCVVLLLLDPIAVLRRCLPRYVSLRRSDPV
jgi:hypothetical protein